MSLHEATRTELEQRIAWYQASYDNTIDRAEQHEGAAKRERERADSDRQIVRDLQTALELMEDMRA